MEDLHIREATAEDKDAVLGIHDKVYHGMDYLQDYYDHFISSPNVTPFVLVKGDKIIGFDAALIVDEGKTLVTKAARLNPNYEGKGLFGCLDNFVTEWAKAKQVITKTFTTSEQNSIIFKPSFRNVYTQILKRTIIMYDVEPDELKLGKCVETRAENLISVSESLLTAYMSTEGLKQYLFPYNRVIVDYIPFKLIKSNVPFMQGLHDNTVIFSDVKNDSNIFSGVLSFGTLLQTDDPSFLYSIDSYGTDSDSFKKHLIAHLNVIKKTVNKTTRVCLFVDMRVPTEPFNQILSDYGITQRLLKDPESSSPRYTDHFVFEKNL